MARFVIAGIALAVAFRAVAAPPDVYFITVDTLRADHLGMYGYPLDTTPNLDRLAAESMVYEDVLCEMTQTGPSMCSMFASQIPRILGTIRNSVPLPEGIVTVTQIFKAAGYETAGVVSNWNLKPELSGLDRGFDRYDAKFGKKWFGRNKHDRTADEVSASALEMIRTRDPEKPFFAWFHFMDPHGKYEFHSAFNPARRPLHEMSPVESMRARYDSEVAFTDHHIGRVLEAIPRENTIIVFAADHGESLNEHGYVGHARSLNQPALRIPLMIHGPGITPGRSEVPVRGIDIGATLLHLAGLAPAESMLGANILELTAESNSVRVMELYGESVPDAADVHAALAEREAQRQTVVMGGWKLIVSGGDRDLYHLPEDPLETDEITGDHPERVAEMLRILEDWDARIPRNTAREAALSPEDRDALKALGYID